MNKLKKNKQRYPYINLICLLMICLLSIITFVLVSCERDDDTKAAKIEDAKTELDNGHYEKAREILEGLDQNDSQVLRYKSDAYSGLAGLHTFNILEVIKEINIDENKDSLDLVGIVLGETRDGVKTNIISKQKITQSLAYFNQAAIQLEKIDGLSETVYIDADCLAFEILSEDEIQDIHFKLALNSQFHAVLEMASIIMNSLNLNEITLSRAAIRALYENEIVDFDSLNGDLLSRLQSIEQDIKRINCALNTLSEQNDFYQLFQEFLSQVDSDGDIKLTEVELEYFLNNLL